MLWCLMVISFFATSTSPFVHSSAPVKIPAIGTDYEKAGLLPTALLEVEATKTAHSDCKSLFIMVIHGYTLSEIH